MFTVSSRREADLMHKEGSVRRSGQQIVVVEAQSHPRHAAVAIMQRLMPILRQRGLHHRLEPLVQLLEI
jgi:hypothetical protein